MNTTSLSLGEDDEDFPRRFAQLPFGDSKTHTLAYGGDDGSVSLIEGDIVKTARRFSERVRAIASSHDGKRVAVGFGDGSTMLFAYKSLDGDVHPFLAALRKAGDKDEDEFFSQIDGMEDDNSDEESFPGPRFQTPVRALVFDPRHSNLLACGSEDSGFCIVDATSSKTLSKQRFLATQSASEHNETGVRGLAYYVNDKQALLASLDLQGRLCVWDVTGDDPELDYELLHKDGHKCVTSVDLGDINDSEPADQACFPVFGKSSFLGLPGSNDLQLRTVDDVDKQRFISSVDGKGHIEPIISLAFSEDEKYAVTGGRDNRIVLWSIEGDGTMAGEIKVQTEPNSVCTHILWVDSVVYFAFENGTFAAVKQEDIIPLKAAVAKERRKTKKPSSTKAATAEKETYVEKTTPEDSKRLAKKSTSTSDSDDEDIDFDEPEENVAKPKTSFIDDEADDDSIPAESSETPNPLSTAEAGDSNDGMVPDDDIMVQDDDALGDDDDDDDYHASRSRSGNGTLVELPEPQPAFAPSSTPLDLTRRIMCWNHIGAITLLRGGDGTTRNTVDIDFTDSAFRRPISFTDNLDFIVGSLGEDGAFFASDLTEGDIDEDDDLEQVVDGLNMSDKTKAAVRKSHQKRMQKGKSTHKSTGSSVYFHRFETFGSLSNKDWVVNLPDAELALGCASGEGWAACITSRRFLRMFSSGGNQGPVMWLKGEPVTIVGRSRFVAVIYHEGVPMPDGTQKLGYTIYDGISTETISSGSLACISSRASLRWAGFSKEGSLMVMDTDGMLSMLVSVEKSDAQNESNMFTWTWSPVLDTVGLRKSLEDSFWPVTVQDGKFICVPLKGGNEHPDAARRPVTTALSMRMPFAYGTDKSTALEELSVRAKLALNQKKFILSNTASEGYDVSEMEDEYNGLCAQVDKVTLKLFMATVESGKLERSLDLVERLHLEKSFDIAITVAERMNHRNLSDKIEDVKDRRFAVDEEEEEEVEDEDELFPDTQLEDTIVRRQTVREPTSRNISPDYSSRNKRSHQDMDNEDDEVTPVVRRTKINPFAKKRLESPGRPVRSPAKSTSTPPRSSVSKLSRLSSFSAKSRATSKVAKKLL